MQHILQLLQIGVQINPRAKNLAPSVEEAGGGVKLSSKKIPLKKKEILPLFNLIWSDS